MQLDPDSDDDGDGVPNCLDECVDTPADADVDNNGCTINPPEEDTAPAELPNDGSDNSDPDTNEPSDDVEEADATISRDQRRLCGLIGPGGLTFLIAGLLALRFTNRAYRRCNV